MVAPISLREHYWDNFEFEDSDLDFIYNFLLESENPSSADELLAAVLDTRISQEIENLKNRQDSKELFYLPKNEYSVGETVVFPALNYQKGEVISIRDGFNPEMTPFKVMSVKLNSGQEKEFAVGLPGHSLNEVVAVNLDDPMLKLNGVINTYGKSFKKQLTAALESKSDLVQIAGRWFPKALLVDVNIGYLNLAEALLDMENGGPLTTEAILEQIDLPTDTNRKLTEFSLNFALQEDNRFDEVGPAGKILWFLHRLEPEKVKSLPMHLEYQALEYDCDDVQEMLDMLENEILDELEPELGKSDHSEEVVISLIYPHLRAGTLPLSERLHHLFPTAYESPRVRFDFIDGTNGNKFPGWVVRKNRYVCGLEEWYKSNNLMPGSILHITKGENPGEVVINPEKQRPTREWVRTAIVSLDGKIIFAMLKQLVSAGFDDRMLIAVPDIEALDGVWQNAKGGQHSLEKIILHMLRELAKLSPQGHVHAEELYAAVNLQRRCPPSQLLSILNNRELFTHLGDLYFRLSEVSGED